jgi:hypothetical protein
MKISRRMEWKYKSKLDKNKERKKEMAKKGKSKRDKKEIKI